MITTTSDPERVDWHRASAEAAISIRDLSISYLRNDDERVDVTAGFDLDVRRGEFLTLIGPSGCGKTSILRAIGGLQKPTTGAVTVLGEPLTGPRPRDISYIFQDFALFPWRTALANVEIALRFTSVPRRQHRQRALEALELVGLADEADRYPRELSGGMQQRVAVARGLVSNSEVLLLDEPFGALDEQTRLILGTELARILEQTGKTIVFVTHSLQEAVFLSTRIVLLSKRPCAIKEIIDVPLTRPRHPDQVTGAVGQRIQQTLFNGLYSESTGA
ncbi:ABC transporter ATP-binding protein [Microbacterium kribbense]|uniref:ABC transporter ATP-binding protein n=1 Tax=Microbacterium kribbense TaxID=433645 RepID=A0ABP7GG10_9MICO